MKMRCGLFLSQSMERRDQWIFLKHAIVTIALNYARGNELTYFVKKMRMLNLHLSHFNIHKNLAAITKLNEGDCIFTFPGYPPDYFRNSRANNGRIRSFMSNFIMRLSRNNF